ncbi:kelch-like protein diablo [Paramacrobiotus metropolitanus]|uniref:kelch-like protein diablo n=1 Tax=Paramacrobiotus metropolitanus TaxID=2943436 RepID=UPI0024457667|nr:kelch-like protein diablo [Paramacrobiotus metropolitanus]
MAVDVLMDKFCQSVATTLAMAETMRNNMRSSRKRKRLSDDASLLRLDGSEFLRGLQEARHDFCDVSLRGAADPTQTDVPWIACHRHVLMARSPWFRRMLRSQMKESQQDTIQLHNIPHDILEQLINYMYSCEITVDASNALGLLQAADFLELGQIVEVCKAFLRENIDLANCLTIYCGAQQLPFADLTAPCRAFALEHFASLCYAAEFLDLDANEICQLIASDELNVEKEEQVVDAVLRWLEHSSDTRMPHVTEMARHIRVPLLAAGYLASLPDSPVGQQLRAAVLSTGESTRALRSSYLSEMVCLWGYNTYSKGKQSGFAATLYRIDPPTSSRWSVGCATPPKSWSGPAVYAVQEGRLRVYVLADVEEAGDPCQLHVYDAGTNEWTELGTFPVPEAILTSVDDRLYLLGGGRVHAYDAEQRQLTARARIPVKRLNSAIVACGGRLYMFGGKMLSSRTDTYQATASAYCYDPASDAWKKLAPMPTARSHCRACVGHDGRIYVTGGYIGGDFNQTIDCVEAYDVQTNQWQSKRAMIVARAQHGLVRLQEQLYAVGGFTTHALGRLPTECYDSATDTWSECALQLPFEQCYMDCAAVQRHIAKKCMQRTDNAEVRD